MRGEIASRPNASGDLCDKPVKSKIFNGSPPRGVW